MGRYYDENYQLLKQKLGEMAAMVQDVISNTIEALSNKDSQLAQKMVEVDERIDRMEVEIDELVLKLLALQQPMAIDLRYLITALKINNDLERMGDQAVNIAQGVLRLDPTHRDAHDNLLLTLNYIEEDPQDVFDEHLRWNRHHAQALTREAPPATNDRNTPTTTKPSRRAEEAFKDLILDGWFGGDKK